MFAAESHLEPRGMKLVVCSLALHRKLIQNTTVLVTFDVATILESRYNPVPEGVTTCFLPDLLLDAGKLPRQLGNCSNINVTLS